MFQYIYIYIDDIFEESKKKISIEIRRVSLYPNDIPFKYQELRFYLISPRV